MGNQKKLLVISVSIGAGHVRAAEAIRETALCHYPDLDVVHLGALSLENKIKRLREHPEKINEMKEKARAISRPHAARSVLDIVSKTLG